MQQQGTILVSLSKSASHRRQIIQAVVFTLSAATFLFVNMTATLRSRDGAVLMAKTLETAKQRSQFPPPSRIYADLPGMWSENSSLIFSVDFNVGDDLKINFFCFFPHRTTALFEHTVEFFTAFWYLASHKVRCFILDEPSAFQFIDFSQSYF